MFIFATNGLTSPQPPWSRAMPTISSPLSRYLSYTLCIPGISALQGPHQVAQKFTTTTLPESPFNSTGVPLDVLRTKFGAAAAFGVEGLFPEQENAFRANTAAIKAT